MHRGADYIVNLCSNHYPAPYYFFIFDENTERELDYSNSQIDVSNPDWQMVSPAEVNLVLA